MRNAVRLAFFAVLAAAAAAPLAALAGRRLFAERVTLRQWLAGGVTAVGVVLAAFG